MKMKYFSLSVFSVCVVAFVFACANGSGGGKPSNNQGGDKPSVETDIKGVWSSDEYQNKNGTGKALVAFDETLAYHAHIKNGKLDTKGEKYPYEFKNGMLSIPAVANEMTFSVTKDEIILTLKRNNKVYKMHKVTTPTLDELKAICN